MLAVSLHRELKQNISVHMQMFQLFFAEAQNEWSGCIRRTSDIGMDDSYVVQRRAMLADETR